MRVVAPSFARVFFVSFPCFFFRFVSAGGGPPACAQSTEFRSPADRSMYKVGKGKFRSWQHHLCVPGLRRGPPRTLPCFPPTIYPPYTGKPHETLRHGKQHTSTLLRLRLFPQPPSSCLFFSRPACPMHNPNHACAIAPARPPLLPYSPSITQSDQSLKVLKSRTSFTISSAFCRRSFISCEFLRRCATSSVSRIESAIRSSR